MRDRAQTIRRARRTSAWRASQAGGCRRPANEGEKSAKPADAGARRLRANNIALCAIEKREATQAAGVSPSQGLLSQVGTRYPDQDPDRASSRRMCIGPGDELPGAPASLTA
jgi:hypothetical protein